MRRSSRELSCDGSPLRQPRPEPLDLVPVVVDLLRTGDGCLMPLRWDRRSRAYPPDVLAEQVAGVASITNDPLRHTRQAIKKWDCVREFVCLTRRDPKRR
jgi:hypothetical protein